MASSIIKMAQQNEQVKQTTKTFSTNNIGRVSGSTLDLFGVANAKVLAIYFNRGSYSIPRQVGIEMYGNAGYTFEFKDNGTPVANSSVSVTIIYIE